MVWSCIAYGYKGQLMIWDKETPEEKKRLDQMLAKENAIKRIRQTERQTQARIPGSNEYQILQEINNRIQQDAAATGQRRMPRRPEWEFKEELFNRGGGNGGIDWLLYREQILRPILYPWIEDIQHRTGEKYWLVEDNAGAHHKSQREGKEERKSEVFRLVCKYTQN